MERELVTVGKACAIADISRSTLYRWIRAGLVERIHTAGGGTRIYVDTLFRQAPPPQRPQRCERTPSLYP